MRFDGARFGDSGRWFRGLAGLKRRRKGEILGWQTGAGIAQLGIDRARNLDRGGIDPGCKFNRRASGHGAGVRFDRQIVKDRLDLFSGGGSAVKGPVRRNALDSFGLICVRTGPPGACVIEYRCQPGSRCAVTKRRAGESAVEAVNCAATFNLGASSPLPIPPKLPKSFFGCAEADAETNRPPTASKAANKRPRNRWFINLFRISDSIIIDFHNRQS